MDIPRYYLSESRARPQLLITDGLVFEQGLWKEAVSPHWVQGCLLLWETSLGSVRRCQELEEDQVGKCSVSTVVSGCPGLYLAECLMGAFPLLESQLISGGGPSSRAVR